MNEWRAPGKKSITRCTLNERQVVIALSGGEIVYFEMDQVEGLNLCGIVLHIYVCMYVEWTAE